MTPKEATAWAKQRAIPCPCCQQPLLLYVLGDHPAHGGPPPGAAAFTHALERLRASGHPVALAPIEEAIHELVEGDAAPMPGQRQS